MPKSQSVRSARSPPPKPCRSLSQRTSFQSSSSKSRQALLQPPIRRRRRAPTQPPRSAAPANAAPFFRGSYKDARLPQHVTSLWARLLPLDAGGLLQLSAHPTLRRRFLDAGQMEVVVLCIPYTICYMRYLGYRYLETTILNAINIET